MRRTGDTAPPERVGDYELWSPLGTGATGVVWKAHRRHPHPQVVALKRLRPDLSHPRDRQRIRGEAALLASLRHRHIVPLVDLVDDGEGVALAMQFAAGGSLAALLAERGRLAPAETVAVGAAIADALWAAHRHGVVHGDVKPANILFTAAGEPLLADFDVARTVRSSVETVAGTPGYLAPEVRRGGPPGPRSDIWSLGVVCYEALVGHPPRTDAPPDAPSDGGAGWDDVPPALATVVARAMATDAARRFGSASELGRALQAAVPTESIRLPRTMPAHMATVGLALQGRHTLRFGPPRAPDGCPATPMVATSGAPVALRRRCLPARQTTSFAATPIVHASS